MEEASSAKFLIYMSQGDKNSFEDFRLAELDALADLEGVKKPFYDEESAKV